VRPTDLLKPGALLEGALFQSLLEEAVALDSVAPGARFGAFRVVRELGRGGMGVVYLAERDDGEFRQSVALKCMVDPGDALSQELFRQEREILAGLRHPFIARLLDGGRSDTGLLWFAMEPIEGQRIDRHCRDAGLSLDERLRLFLHVLEAVEFAHARLLIHRDIKPGNVLVDVDGRPKLLDFGISAFSRDGSGASAWSPGFASPEQLARGEVGTASDQYQLGRLLDAMLCVAGPASAPEAAPRGPRLGQWLPMPAVRVRELAAVVARTLREHPSERYGSVAELRQDVERLLARRPVLARSGGPGYRAGCLLRRRPLAVPAVTAVLTAFAVLVAAFNVQVAKERDLAVLEAEKARAVTTFLVDDILTAADPFAAQSSELSVREALDRARGRIGGRFGAQPLVEAEIRTVLGRTYLNIGEIDAAAAELDAAEALLTRDAVAMSAELARVHLMRADIGRYQGDFLETEARLAALLPEFTAALGEDHEWTLWAEVQRHEFLYLGGRIPESAALAAMLEPRLLRALGAEHEATERFLNGRGHREVLQGDLALAGETFSRLAAQREARLGRDHVNTLQSLNGLVRVLRGQQRWAEAEALILENVAARERVFGRRHPETLDSLNELAIVRVEQGDAAAAIEIWQEMLEIKHELLGEEHHSTLTTRYNLARLAQMSGDYPAAREGFQALYDIEARVFGRENAGTTVTLISLAAAIFQTGDASEAMTLMDEALPLAEVWLAGRPEIGVMYTMRGEVLMGLGRYEQAERELRQGLAMLEAASLPDHPQARRARDLLAELP
jgi:eukaryotic-like serine/threonine-protein kinase